MKYSEFLKRVLKELEAKSHFEEAKGTYFLCVIISRFSYTADKEVNKHCNSLRNTILRKLVNHAKRNDCPVNEVTLTQILPNGCMNPRGARCVWLHTLIEIHERKGN